jgi:hypothetical protein
MVKRYSVYLPHYETGEIEEMQDGEYVQYTDYAALAERCERLEAALILGKNGEWDKANDVLEFGSSGGKE